MNSIFEDPKWTLISGWMKVSESNYWKEQLLNNISWDQPQVKVYGKRYHVPRLTSFLADEGITYSYSGYKHESVGMPDWFMPLCLLVSKTCGEKFNGCLVNLYRNGLDRMGWHSDNETELDKTKKIASLSLGSSRDISFKHLIKPLKSTFPLSNGDLLLMEPECQSEWLHSIPPRKLINDLRINLTFRCYK